MWKNDRAGMPKKSWRPEGWDKMVEKEYMHFGGDRQIFEAGADAMYKPAYEKGIRDTLEWCKKRHYLVDYDLKKFIAQLEEQ